MSTPMLDVARELLTNEDAKSAFQEDPEGFLADRGLTDWEPGEVAEALGYVTEALPHADAAGLPTADALLDGESGGPEALGRLSELAPGGESELLGTDTAALDDLDAGATYGAGADTPDAEEPEAEADLDELQPDFADVTAEVSDERAGPGEEPPAEDGDGEEPSPDDGSSEPDDGSGEPADDPLSGLD